MSIRTANELLNILVREVKPPPGCPIQLTEIKPATDNFPNWAASVGNLPADAQFRYDSAVVELRRQDQFVDWQGVEANASGGRRFVVEPHGATISSADDSIEMTADEIAQQIAGKIGVNSAQIVVVSTLAGGWDATLIVATPAASKAAAGLAQVVRALQSRFELKN